MFKFLKDKIKSWTKKISKEVEPVESPEIVETKEVKEPALESVPSGTRTSDEVPSEEGKKEIPLPKKFNAGARTFEPDLEKLEEEIIETEKLIDKEIEPPLKEITQITTPEEKPIEPPKPTPQPGTEGFFKRIVSKIKKIKISEQTFEVYSEELEMLLLENNVALEVAEKIIKELKEKIIGKELLKKEVETEIQDALKEIIEEILIEPFDIADKIKEKKADQSKEPYVVLFCGINGTGKTTTIAKITEYLKHKKLSCVLAAADTFRAASIEQIKKHGEKLKTKVIAHDYGSDPASVGFDAIQYAKKNFIDCVLIDTAGRMHTAKNLLKEIEKISKVCKPDTTVFVGESLTGNDIVEQVKNFDWAIGIDGIILTKADIDEKGGTALSVGYVTKKPILYLGCGQLYDDIVPFDKKDFIRKLGL